MCQERPLLDQLREHIDESETLIILSPDFDSAIIGISRQFNNPPVVVYNREMVIRILMIDGEMSQEEAEEYFVFNVETAYLGEATPAFISLIDHGMDGTWNGVTGFSVPATNPRNNC